MLCVDHPYLLRVQYRLDRAALCGIAPDSVWEYDPHIAVWVFEQARQFRCVPPSGSIIITDNRDALDVSRHRLGKGWKPRCRSRRPHP
jgi:hypothetical protein